MQARAFILFFFFSISFGCDHGNKGTRHKVETAWIPEWVPEGRLPSAFLGGNLHCDRPLSSRGVFVTAPCLSHRQTLTSSHHQQTQRINLEKSALHSNSFREYLGLSVAYRHLIHKWKYKWVPPRQCVTQKPQRLGSEHRAYKCALGRLLLRFGLQQTHLLTLNKSICTSGPEFFSWM